MSATVVVITGASAGIGAATARLLGTKGTSLALVARRKERLDAVAAESGGHALPIVADVTERAENRRVVEAAVARFGHIDVWINNVGRGISVAPSKLTDEDVDEMMRANVMSALYGMQEVLPHFRERGRGHVINVSSLLGRVPFATIRSAYCGAKHFLNALTATFRAEVQETHPDIQFSLVSPGVVWTDFGSSARHGGPDSRSFPDGQPPEDVAAVIADVITTRRPDVYTRAGMKDRIASYYAGVAQDP